MAVESSQRASVPTDPEDDEEMTFFEHLGELRSRIMRSLYALVPAFGVCWLYSNWILGQLVAPLEAAWVSMRDKGAALNRPDLNFHNPTDALIAYLQVSFVFSLLLASPWIFYQAWQFVAPGLYRSEKRLAIPFVLVSTLFFLGGALFGYFLVLPPALETFLGYAGSVPGTQLTLNAMLEIDEYLDFELRMLLAFGVVFEVPVVVSFLSFAGIVNWKQLLNFARWWVVIASIIAAILTPPDVGSQLLMLVPLVVLYLLSIVLAWMFGPKVPAEEPKKVETDKEPS
jgi:sec-independent protein translocase protein TatC